MLLFSLFKISTTFSGVPVWVKFYIQLETNSNWHHTLSEYEKPDNVQLGNGFWNDKTDAKLKIKLFEIGCPVRFPDLYNYS